MSNIRITALGGLDEDGKNLYCLEIDGKIIVVNAGLKLPEDNQYGIRYIVPDFSYLEANRERIIGVILTHAHDDMMNGLPQLLIRINLPVYGPEMCRRVLKHILKPADWDKLNYHVVDRNGEFKIGEFNVTTFALTHATPDAIGIAIETENGQIVIAEIDGESTVKQYHYDEERQQVWLQPCNPNYRPIEIQPTQTFLILGIVERIIKQVV